MQKTPKGLRLHIALMGRVNAGKSTFLNLLTGQDAAITSPIAGTTTDVVEKAQELAPVGPVLWLDTAGLGDTGELSAERLEKTQAVWNRADIILLVTAGDTFGEPEEQIVREAKNRKIPLIRIKNTTDLCAPVMAENSSIKLNALDKDNRHNVLNLITKEILKVCPEDFLNAIPMLGDLAPENGTVIMIVPIDTDAPKGRLILPQVQAIRDCLDHHQTVVIVKEDAYPSILANLKNPPDLVVCDSQVVRHMVLQTPKNLKCTTFSILMARLKGDLAKLMEGAAAIQTLKDGDRVLIAESCTHHASDDDIGTVKIPRLLGQKTGRMLHIDHVSGCSFPPNLQDYALVIQCGGCMQNRREILSRIQKCGADGVPITNYGICLSALNGVLEKVLEPFPLILEKYRKEVK